MVIISLQEIKIKPGDGQDGEVYFPKIIDEVEIIKKFDPENLEELQKVGWQMMLENFKKYAETS